MKRYLTNLVTTVLAVGKQFLLWLDQGGNVLLPGIGAILRALLTGRASNPGYADETLSAHAWRAYADRKFWGRLFMPPIDLLFLWQRQDREVNDRVGRSVDGHCERAFYKEALRREMPPEYRDALNDLGDDP